MQGRANNKKWCATIDARIDKTRVGGAQKSQKNKNWKIGKEKKI